MATKAKFQRSCKRCGGIIEIGSYIENGPGGWSHVECPATDDDWPQDLAPTENDNPWNGAESVREINDANPDYKPRPVQGYDEYLYEGHPEDDPWIQHPID